QGRLSVVGHRGGTLVHRQGGRLVLDEVGVLADDHEGAGQFGPLLQDALGQAFLDDRQGVLVALGVQVAHVERAVLVGIAELALGLGVGEQRHGLVVLLGLLVGGDGVHARHLVLGIGGDLGGIDFGRLGIALQAHQRTAAQVLRLGLVGLCF